ncbi:MAG: AraC family transcriptional regulator [Cyclobacteriaceae bacterium]
MSSEYRINLFAIIILMGVIQGLVLGVIFLVGNSPASKKYLGAILLTFSLLLVDVFLCYSNYMLDVIWLNNFSEPLNFLFAPLFYLYVRASLTNEKFSKKLLWHFMPAAFYFGYSMMYWGQPNEVKLYDFYSAFQMSVDGLAYPMKFNFDPLGIRQYVNELTIILVLIYWILILLKSRAYKKAEHISQINILNWVFGIAILILIVVKAIFKSDIGDYLVASYLSLSIYLTDFFIIRKTVRQTLSGQYKKSSLSQERKQIIHKKVIDVMEHDHYYRNDLASLGELSEKVNATSHHVSQVLNEVVGKSFFELLAHYRIAEAKSILINPSETLTVEQIAIKVGYNSKSAFNKAFKKLTGSTPMQYRQSSTQHIK